MNTLDTLTAELLARCDRLATYTEVPGQTTRTFLSAPMREVHALVQTWMGAAGMRVQMDAAGNLRGVYAGRTPDAPILYIGSHLDTVPNAGRYDGPLGVLAGVALVQALGGERLNFAVEVLAFSEEEGVRFRAPFIGSRALVGSVGEMLTLTDDAGVTVEAAIRAYGLNPAGLPEAVAPTGALGYLELHIEQGPVLESMDRPLGVVEALVGQLRLDLGFTGRANHAGTTPMPLRHDALAGAAEFVLAAERLARSTPGLAATVGRMEALPGAANVIPGEARFTLDLRHASDEVRDAALDQLLSEVGRIAETRGLKFEHAQTARIPAVPLDPHLTRLLHQCAGPDTPSLTSGAGHDAMVMAARMPSAMLFVRSPGGVSHHPDEAVIEADVRAALKVGLKFLHALSAEVGRA